jgi:hypothetical protein
MGDEEIAEIYLFQVAFLRVGAFATLLRRPRFLPQLLPIHFGGAGKEKGACCVKILAQPARPTLPRCHHRELSSGV